MTEGIAGENIATSHRQQEETVVLKDAKLWPSGGVRAWDWSETGTRHNPGIQIADAEELLAGGATTVVLSRGMYMKLGVPDATVEALRARKVRVAPSEGGDDACEQGVAVEVIVAETREAVRIYNELVAKGVKVGGLFHSTC